MFLTRVRAAIAALVAIVIAGVLAVPAQAAVGDIFTVSGTVTDASGAPLAGLTVNVWGLPEMHNTTTAEDGTYSLEIVAAYDVSYPSVQVADATCDSTGPVVAPTSVVVNCVARSYITVTLEGTATADDGSSLAGQWVNVHDSTSGMGVGAAIQEDGSFQVVARVDATATYIEISGPGTPSYQYTEFADGTVLSGLNLTFHPYPTYVPTDMTVQGRVTDKKGRPIAGASVEVSQGWDAVSATTDAQGYYTATGAYPWSDEDPISPTAWVTVDGVVVDWVSNLSPYEPVTVDYRVGKSPLFEPFATGLELTGWGSTTDVYRKIDADKSAEWRVCTDSWCYGFDFGSKKTEIFHVFPVSNGGVAQVLLRDVNAGVVQWQLFSPDGVNPAAATFGPKNLDGVDYFDFTGIGAPSVVAWAQAGGDTTVWSWGPIDWDAQLRSTVMPGKFVSMEHLDLDAADGDEMVVVTQEGKNYTVYLIASAYEQAVAVASGRGEPTVTYDDADGDGVFDIVVTYPDHTKHRHHCK